MKRIFLAALGALSLSACAQAPESGVAKVPAAAAATKVTTAAAGTAPKVATGSPDARAIAAVHMLNPQVTVDRVGQAPLPGFREAVAGGQVVYVSDDGRYLFVPGPGGALFDTSSKKNLSEIALAGLRRELLQTIPVSERIVFAPANPKYTVSIFTDVECGYCRKLHSQIGEYNRQGIAVQYLAFPRMGLGSDDFRKMVSIWCAPDRRKALSDAKEDRQIAPRDCKNTVTMQYDVGQRAGLNGTPMILAADGTQVGGYLSPAQLRDALDKLAEGAAASSVAGPTDPLPAGGSGA